MNDVSIDVGNIKCTYFRVEVVSDDADVCKKYNNIMKDHLKTFLHASVYFYKYGTSYYCFYNNDVANEFVNEIRRKMNYREKMSVTKITVGFSYIS